MYFAPDIYHNILHLAASMLKNQTPNLAYLNSNASKYSLPFEFQGLIYQNAKKNEEKRLAQINSDINLSIPTKCRSYFIIFVISFICERKTFKVQFILSNGGILSIYIFLGRRYTNNWRLLLNPTVSKLSHFECFFPFFP